MPSSPFASHPPPVPPPRRVIIVGAGVAGLSAAQELLRSPLNLDVVVLEARNRLGGRILTHWLSADEPQPSLSTPNILNDSNHPELTSDNNLTHQSIPQQGLLTHLPHPNNASALHPLQANPSHNPSSQSHDPRDWSNQARINTGLNSNYNPNINHNLGTTLSNTLSPQYSPNPYAPQISPGPLRHSFANLSSGAAVADRTSSHGAQRISVDIGASIMHGCGDENQLVFKRAIHERIRAPIVAGGGFYESTEHAVWYDDNTATRVPSDKIVEMHNIFFMASRYMAAVASQSDDGAANMQTIFNYGVSYVCDHLQNRVLTASELAILKKICARSVGYCSPMSAMALMQASAGMEPTSADAHIGVVHEEDDPPFPGEVPLMHLAAIRQQAARLSKSVASTQRLPKSMIASRKGGSGDRIVLDGYTPFLIDRLKDGVDVRLNQSVCGVSRAVKAPLDPSLQFPQEPDPRLRATRAGQRNRSDALQFSNWHSDPEAASRTILVSTRSGEVYQADFVLITLPLGVLKSEHEESSISFSPPLSEEKQEAIRGMGMGVHNKIVLRFKEDEVFWPSKVPQLNCLDPRFQFFNLHCYGKTGVLLVHVFAESGFANRFWGLTDEAVVAEVLMVLGGMFCDQETPFDSATIRTTSKTPDGRRRVAALLNICENCRRPLQPGPFGHFSGRDNGDVACKACGFVAQKLEEKPGEEGDQQSRSLDKADGKQQNQPVLLTNEEEEVIPSSRKFTWYDFPAPEEYIVTRWEDDPFALGSYSYMPCGSSWTMIEQMAAPEPRDSEHPYLFFAGEHCSDLGWQCVHGAHETGIRAAREILGCLQGGPLLENTEDAVRALQRAPTPRSVKHSSQPDSFWTSERERALTRALIGYSDVYGNFSDVMDEMAHALQTFKKEPTDLTREKIRDLILQRIHERAQDDNVESKAFLRFHTGEGVARDEVFPKPFQEVHKRPRLIGLNGSKLKEKYSPDIIRELKSYASAVSQNQISYRETLRKIAVMVYKKDGGLMTKRCLPEYLRTQEFGTGPQKELFLEKYLSPKGQ